MSRKKCESALKSSITLASEKTIALTGLISMVLAVRFTAKHLFRADSNV